MILVSIADVAPVRNADQRALRVARGHLQVLHDLKGEPLMSIAINLRPFARLRRLVLEQQLLAKNTCLFQNDRVVEFRRQTRVHLGITTPREWAGGGAVAIYCLPSGREAGNELRY